MCGWGVGIRDLPNILWVVNSQLSSTHQTDSPRKTERFVVLPLPRSLRDSTSLWSEFWGLKAQAWPTPAEFIQPFIY